MDNLLYSCFSFPNKPEHLTQKICIFSSAEFHRADWPRTQRRQCWNSVPPLWARLLVSWNVSRGANSKTTDTEGETWLPEETVGHPANTKTAGPFVLSTVNKKRWAWQTGISLNEHPSQNPFRQPSLGIPSPTTGSTFWRKYKDSNSDNRKDKTFR